jgi:hypothetical protein
VAVASQCLCGAIHPQEDEAGHVIGSHIGGSGQLLPYIRSTQGSGNGQASWGGGVWHGGNTQSPQWGGRAAATGSSGAGH